MIAMRRPRLVSCVNGTTAVEFAMVLPPVLIFLIGTMSASVAVFSTASLHYAVEGAARCYSVNASTCPSTTTTQSYAQKIYFGPSSPTFTASLSSTTCGNATNPGHQVNATLNVVLGTGMAQWNIPLSATACFP
jgi:Flp pilus assembly protein TadG